MTDYYIKIKAEKSRNPKELLEYMDNNDKKNPEPIELDWVVTEYTLTKILDLINQDIHMTEIKEMLKKFNNK